MTEGVQAPPDVTVCLRKLAPNLPSNIRYRLLKCLDHFDRAECLFEVDREMASFRAITGEEEAATCVILAIKARRYEHSERFRPWNHLDKAAVVSALIAIAPTVVPLLSEFQLVFDFSKCRIDLKIPLSNFNIDGGENVAVQPVEPLDQTFSRPYIPENEAFDAAFERLTGEEGPQSLLTLIRKAAQSRNTILYASDTALPESKATKESLYSRRIKAQTLLVIAVMIIQHNGHAKLISQLIVPVLKAIERAPS